MKHLSLVVLLLVLLTAATMADQPTVERLPFWSTSELNVTTTGMIWRDCNNDGFLDAFFSNGNDITQSPNTIYLFNGSALPTNADWLSSNHEFSGHCAVGDIDDDGFADFVVANFLGSGFDAPNRSDFYHNLGGVPSVTPDWHTPDSIYSFSCALGDVDGDGDLDLAFATGEGYTDQPQKDLIYLNDNGAFSETAWWQSSSFTEALDVTWGDVDNDGDLDLAFTYHNGRTAVHYNNGGLIESFPSWQSASSESGNTLIWADVTGDDWLDLVVAYNFQVQANSGYFRVYFNDGTGNLNSSYGWQSDDSHYGSALAVYDYDNDGDDDLAAGRWFHDVLIYENLGTTFTTSPVWRSDVDMVAEELAWADLDGNGVVLMADTLGGDGNGKLFYTGHHPLYAIDSVIRDGVKLGYDGFCYDLISGWVSLADAPLSECVVHHKYSFNNDLTVCNWDTVSMAFADTSVGFIEMYVEPRLGAAPSEVTLADLSVDVQARDWDLGDDQHSADSSLVHMYDEPGLFPVRLSVTKAGKAYSRAVPMVVAVHADTLQGGRANAELGAQVRVDISAVNYLPVDAMTIPFNWDGDLKVTFDSIATTGLRTDYFAEKVVVNYVSIWKSATISLKSGAMTALEPGSGPVISLWFTVNSSGPSCPIEIAPYLSYQAEFATPYGDYVPTLRPGQISLGCCEGTVGDVNGLGGNEPSISDIGAIVEFLFISGTPPGCMAEADVNQSGGPDPGPTAVTVADIGTLVDYLFITGTPLRTCF